MDTTSYIIPTINRNDVNTYLWLLENADNSIAESEDKTMTDRERLDRLSKCLKAYLDKEGCMPVEGSRNRFYDGVLWAFARLVEIYPSDEQTDMTESEDK